MLSIFGELFATKCVFLNNQPCLTGLTLIDLNSSKLSFYLFVVSLDKSCNTVDDLSDRIYLPIKTKNLNVKVFNFATGFNQKLVKHISCDCNAEIKKVIQAKNGIKVSVDVTVKNQ